MAEAGAEQRAPRVGAGGDEVEADARVIGRAGAGRDEDRVGAGAKGLCRGERVVAFDAHLGAQLDQIVNEVEGEAVIIVDDEAHGARTNGFAEVGEGRYVWEARKRVVWGKSVAVRVDHGENCLITKKTKRPIQRCN